MSKSKTILEEKQSYISSAVADAHTAYLSNNPISAKAHHNATEYMPGGNTRTVLHAQPFSSFY
jgi:glutamate-1-semialdehyde 2,1-aminomutase